LGFGEVSSEEISQKNRSAENKMDICSRQINELRIMVEGILKLRGINPEYQ
jgi:hypothetical protein